MRCSITTITTSSWRATTPRRRSRPQNADLPMYMEFAKQLGSPVLDVGCGTGRVAIPLARAGADVVAIDKSPKMLDRARKKIADEPSDAQQRVTWVEAPMQDFTVGTNFKMAFLAFNILPLLPGKRDQELAMQAVAKSLVPGGTLIIDLLNPYVLASQPMGTISHIYTLPIEGTGKTVTVTDAMLEYNVASQMSWRVRTFEYTDRLGLSRRHHLTIGFRHVYKIESEYLLEKAGFELIEYFGSYDRQQPYQMYSRNMVIIARKRS